ncbi:hypothetical protein [Lacinutrix sp. MEBiC02595]
MKYKILIHLIYGLIYIILISCGNKSEAKTNNSTATEIESKGEDKNQLLLVESSENHEIEVFLENNAEFIIVGKPTVIYFKRKMLYKALNKVVVKHVKIDLMEDFKVHMHDANLSLTATEENLESGFIEIEITEKIKNEEDLIHKFNFPVKKQDSTTQD